MKLLKNLGKACLWGALYGLVAILLSRLLLRSLSEIILAFGGSGIVIKQIVKAVAQLKTAAINSPWLPAALLGAALGILSVLVIKKPRVRAWVCTILGILLLIPAVALALCFTSVNSVRILELVKTLLPLLALL